MVKVYSEGFDEMDYYIPAIFAAIHTLTFVVGHDRKGSASGSVLLIHLLQSGIDHRSVSRRSRHWYLSFENSIGTISVQCVWLIGGLLLPFGMYLNILKYDRIFYLFCLCLFSGTYLLLKYVYIPTMCSIGHGCVGGSRSGLCGK